MMRPGGAPENHRARGASLPGLANLTDNPGRAQLTLRIANDPAGSSYSLSPPLSPPAGTCCCLVQRTLGWAGAWLESVQSICLLTVGPRSLVRVIPPIRPPVLGACTFTI